jgi:hypothetical protein
VDDSEKIKIILEEYKSLRTEIMQRHAGIIQVYTVAGTAFVGVVGFAVFNTTILGGVLMTLVLIVLVVGAFFLHDHDIRMLAKRLRIIEADINQRAQENLLDWETSYGLLSVDYDDRVWRIWAWASRIFRRDRIS